MTAGLPVPSFAIGATVWMARTSEKQETVPCPDCKGTRQWAALTAAGETIAVKCQRCTPYASTKLPSLTRRTKRVLVERLTVGKVRTRFDSDFPTENAVSYMCTETGVGSGNVYSEGHGGHGLYGTEAEAREASEQMRATEQANLNQAPQALQAEHYASMPMDVALVERYWGEIWNAWYQARQLREVIEEVLADETSKLPTEVGETLDRALQEPSWPNPHPLKALLAAAEAVLATDTVTDLAALRVALDTIKKPVDA